MGKARDQIPPPVVTPPPDQRATDLCACEHGKSRHTHSGSGPCAEPGCQCDAFSPHPQPRLPSEAAHDLRNPADAAGYTQPYVTELAARAITNAAGMAREYASAAGELCRTADHNPQARANARRLLRLALAHLEA